MKMEALIKKFLEEKFKVFMNKSNEYNTNDALEILENDYYDDFDLFIWAEEKDQNEPIVFDLKDEAIEYINNKNPEKFFIEFSECVLIEDAITDLGDYLLDTDEIKEETKIEIIQFLINDYLNKCSEDDEDIELLEYVQELPDFEVIDMMREDNGLLHKLISDFSLFYEESNNVLYAEPNKEFFKEKNIRFINEVCKDFLVNFHNYNFTNGCDDEKSINLIYNFLCSKFKLDDEYYEYYFGKYFYSHYKLNKSLILMIISDYYRLLCSKRNEENFLGKNDIEYLNLIENYTPQQLILEFELNEKFGKTVVSDYMYFNDYYDLKENKDNIVQKQLKKIDPFYGFNK